MKLNLGCGRRPMDGWVNVDCVPLPGVDLVVELDAPDKVSLPWADDSVDELAMIHVLEHISHPLPLMQELWRVAKPKATIMIACPYGSSDDADEDPTHVRRMFLQSFGYFGQPFYHRADYGYRGDWAVDLITLDVGAHYDGVDKGDIMRDVALLRNIVQQMTAELHAVKPAREPRQELGEQPKVRFRVVT
jgi:SAM-dependent methyltransferase